MTYQPFWFDQAMAEETISVSSTSIDENPYDIAIIGGGFTGLWTAITIKQRAPKTRIVILEKDLCGQGASGRNGGAMLTWSTKYLSLKKRFGESQAKWLVQQSENAVHAISQFAKEHNIDCDFSPGIINATINRKDTNNLFDEVNNLKKKYQYTKIQKLSSSELSTIIDTDLYDGGCLDFGAGHLNPLKFVQGLGTAAKKNNVQIFAFLFYHSIREKESNT